VIEPSALSTLRQALFKRFLSCFDSVETFPPKIECTTSVGLIYWVSWVPILVIVFVFLTASVRFPFFLGGVSQSGPLCVDAFEDMTFFHRVVGLGMELARSFQRLVVVFLVVSPSIGMFDCVYLVIIVARSLSSEIVKIITTPVPPFSVVAVVAAAGIPVIETPTAVILSGRLLGSSYVFSDELFCVVGIGIVLGCGEELGDRDRPFAQ